ncbi:hypothetical protein FE236_13360 [Mariprofundus erugo]|uniref:hypothetical protein n=1 Tax=Mariprofundus erugo TaxID=2528639 RepID=UPI0010FD78D6|nr:hypothetical protein [Mariprofundus erugo]TLS72879.1 hypothetical protein FE236_13360 [Mariprofundus erugo]
MPELTVSEFTAGLGLDQKNRQVVYQDVTKYVQNSEYIVGLKVKSKFLTNAFPEVPDKQPYGYFVIKKDTCELLFLEESEFLKFVDKQKIEW